MTDDELREWQEDDPKGYAANLARQTRSELKAEIMEELANKSTEDKIANTFDDYADKNPTFNEMWNSGELQRFMNVNPGHNAMSAHMMLTSDARIEEERNKATEEAEKRAAKKYKAKAHSSVLGGGPSHGGQSDLIPTELEDTKKFGGQTTVLVKRSLERERQRAAG